MRKNVFIIITTAALITLSACSKTQSGIDANITSIPTQAQTVTKSPTDTPYTLTETPTPTQELPSFTETKISEVTYIKGRGVHVAVSGPLLAEEMPVGRFYWHTMARNHKELPTPPEEWSDCRLLDRVQIGDNAWYESYVGHLTAEDENATMYGRITGTGAVWDHNGEITVTNNHEIGEYKIEVTFLPDERWTALWDVCPYATDLVIDEGITELGDFSLVPFKFTRIYFPSTLKKIGKATFSSTDDGYEGSCDRLRKEEGYNLPKDVEIDEYAFAYPVHHEYAYNRFYDFNFNEFQSYSFLARYEDEAIALCKELFPEYKWIYNESYGKEILDY